MWPATRAARAAEPGADSTPYQACVGWMVFGGTSVSSPVIASVFALAGNSASIDNNYPCARSTSLWDVTSGSNGSCSPSRLCTARTGLGTPARPSPPLVPQGP